MIVPLEGDAYRFSLDHTIEINKRTIPAMHSHLTKASTIPCERTTVTQESIAPGQQKSAPKQSDRHHGGAQRTQRQIISRLLYPRRIGAMQRRGILGGL
jgi:hypothetical protein